MLFQMMVVVSNEIVGIVSVEGLIKRSKFFKYSSFKTTDRILALSPEFISNVSGKLIRLGFPLDTRLPA